MSKRYALWKNVRKGAWLLLHDRGEPERVVFDGFTDTGMVKCHANRPDGRLAFTGVYLAHKFTTESYTPLYGEGTRADD